MGNSHIRLFFYLKTKQKMSLNNFFIDTENNIYHKRLLEVKGRFEMQCLSKILLNK